MTVTRPIDSPRMVMPCEHGEGIAMLCDESLPEGLLRDSTQVRTAALR